jgi:hypothetical protein
VRERTPDPSLKRKAEKKKKKKSRGQGDQVIRENPASRGTEASAEVLVGK